MDGYSKYNKVKKSKNNNEKNAFILEWGAYAYNILPIGKRYGKTIE
jgi:hypothetical protein